MSPRVLIAAVSAALAAALLPVSAGAIPPFARKYETSCQTCHAYSFPLLNPYGRRFKENGYQLPAGAEEPARARASTAAGEHGERLEIPFAPPVAVRARIDVQAQHDLPRSVNLPVDLGFPSRVDLVAGGSLFPDVAAMAAVQLAPTQIVHQAFLSFTHLAGSDALNARIGEFQAMDWARPSHRDLTALSNPVEEVIVGANPAQLDSHAIGVELYGRPRLGPFFYQLDVFEGPYQASGRDLDAFKDFFGRASWDFLEGKLTVGAFGALGWARVGYTGGGVTRRFTDRWDGEGLDLQWHALDRLLVWAELVRGKHQNPVGTTPAVGYWGWRLEADLAITDRVFAIARLDSVSPSIASDDYSANRALIGPQLDQQYLTLQLSHLILTNLRASLEYGYSRSGSDGIALDTATDFLERARHLFTLRLDLAL